MRVLLRLALGVAVLLLLLGAGLAYLLHSPQGTRWLWQSAADWVPGELTAASLEGRLTGPLEIRGFSYRDGALSLSAALLRLDWEPFALLQGRLHLVDLTLEAPHLALPPAEAEAAPAETGPFTGFLLPLAVDLDQIRVEDLQLLTEPGREPLVVDHLLLAARGRGTAISVTTLEAAALSADLRAAGEVRLAPRLPLALELYWGYRLPDGPRLAGAGSVEGDLGRLHLTQRLQAPLEGRLDATLLALETSPRWEAVLDLEALELGALVPAFPAHLNGRLESTGEPADMGLSGTLALREPTLGTLDTELQARFDGRRVHIQTLKAVTATGASLAAKGRYALGEDLGSFALQLDWSGLRWPLTGEVVQLSSGQGRLQLDGTPMDYGYRLSGDLRAAGQPSLEIQAEGRGGLQSIRFEPLLARLPEGRLQARGEAAWAPRVRWEAALEGEGLDPALFLAEFPGRLDLALDSQGRVAPAGLELQAHLKRLEGRLRGYPVSAGGRVRLAGAQLQVEQLQLSSGSARADVKGSLGQQWNLDWSLRAPDLGNLWPGLAGALEGSGRLGGSAERPQIRADLRGSGIRYQAQGVKHLVAEADLALDPGRPMSLDIRAEGLEAGGMRWQKLTLRGNGTRAQHVLKLDLSGKQAVDLELALGASLAPDETWTGRLQQLVLDDPAAGRWALQRPAAFSLGVGAQRLETLCLEGAPGALCGSFTGRAEQGWKADLKAPQLALDAFGPWLPEALRLTGEGALEADLSADPTGRIRGQARFGVPRGSLGLEVAGRPQTVDFSGTRARAELGPKGGEARLRVPLSGLGQVEGELRLPGLDLAQLDPQRQLLEGRVQARVSDLGLVSALVPRLADVRGRLDADFKLSGRLAAPQIQGQANLVEGALDVPELGLQVRELELALSAPTLDRVELKGAVRSGGGRLTLSGDTRLDPAAGFPTRLKLEGRDVVVVNVPEAEVQVSPKLTLEHDADQSRLQGEIRIPYARIRPRELPATAVSSSSDLVVVGGDTPSEPKTDPRFHSRLRILFGDRVSFEGFGLRGRLTGDLEVIDEPGRPVIGRGRVGIADGTYRAYGQDLKIERGYAQFADSPVDNPGLDVRAVREVGEVTAGLRVTGTLKKPKLDLFSTPSMTQSEILSYLLTGRPPGAGGGGAGLTAALAASGAGDVTSEISRQLGLDELRVETGSDLNEASVVAGTWLSPRLYVQYVNELATRDTKLRLRYDLTDKLQIQTETGRSQGVDLYYTIER